MRAFNQVEIREEMLKSITEGGWSKQRYGQLARVLQKRDSTLVADALLSVIRYAEGDEGFAAQDMVGKLLLELSPTPSDSLQDIVDSILPVWNKSVKEIPRYLALIFGEKEVRMAVAKVTEGIDIHILDQARTFEWWLE